MTRALDDGFAPGEHATTFGATPPVAAAALAVLDTIEAEDLLGNAERVGTHLRSGCAGVPGVAGVRGLGLLLAVELASGDAPGVARRLLDEEHVLVNAVSPTALRLCPPLVLTRRGRRPRGRGDRPRAGLTDSSRAAPPPIMAPVHAPRLALLLVPAMAAVVVAHAYDGEGRWEVLVSILAVLAATLAILLARRDASTALARIATATGTVPYAGRLHPDGSWRGHVAGPGAARMLGAPYSGAAWTAAVHPDDREAFIEACRAPRAARRSEVEYRIVRPDGEVREIWDRLLPSKGGAIEGVRVDVTERRATERQLSTARRRLESVLHQLDETS